MYSIIMKDIGLKHDLDELIRVFIKPSDFEFIENRQDAEKDAIIIEYPSTAKDKDDLKRYYYKELNKITGYQPPWGILTGVRPTKKCNEHLSAGLTKSAIQELLINEYYVSEDKARLVLETCLNQLMINQMTTKNLVGIYIGIPFCPTRCVYCSFASNQFDQKKIDLYLAALFQEIDYVAAMLKNLQIYPETIYLGGGTPTSLSEIDFERLIIKIHDQFDFSEVKEFTIEAGRPDTITLKKLECIHRYHGNRISINPQSMNQRTLDLIGRNHTPEQIVEAFKMAEAAGIPIINADIIAGLPGESDLEFSRSLEQVIKLSPQNITVHTLAMKRASKLKVVDKDYNYLEHVSLNDLLKNANQTLKAFGYDPYYLYRQKQTTGNFENVGFATKGTQGIYNVRIMEERQSIIALGAGGISKIYFPDENRHERVPNVSDLSHYIDRIQEMIKRKDDMIAGPLSGIMNKK